MNIEYIQKRYPIPIMSGSIINQVLPVCLSIDITIHNMKKKKIGFMFLCFYVINVR